MKTIKFKTGILLLFIFASSYSYSQNNETEGNSLQHVLLFKWVDKVDLEAKNEVLTLFKNLPNKIEGFESTNVYKVDNSSGKFDIIIIMKFATQEALDVYQEHPDHNRVKEIAPSLLSGFGEVDYWEKVIQ